MYNGAEVGHEVEPFVGERITLIAFNEPGLPQQESFQTSAYKRREGKAWQEEAFPAPEAKMAEKLQELNIREFATPTWRRSSTKTSVKRSD